MLYKHQIKKKLINLFLYCINYIVIFLFYLLYYPIVNYEGLQILRTFLKLFKRFSCVQDYKVMRPEFKPQARHLQRYIKNFFFRHLIFSRFLKNSESKQITFKYLSTSFETVFKLWVLSLVHRRNTHNTDGLIGVDVKLYVLLSMEKINTQQIDSK